MKLAIDEKLKHRITGVAVLVSVIIIFLPAMIKHSNRHIENKVNVAMKLPKKPGFPKLSKIDTQAQVFNMEKPPQVVMDYVEHTKIASNDVHATSLKAQKNVAQDVSRESKATITPIKVAKINTAPITPHFAVQVGSFSEKNNADNLLQKIKNNGYKVSTNKNGNKFVVVVGNENTKSHAQELQIKLAKGMDVKGFVVKTG